MYGINVLSLGISVKLETVAVAGSVIERARIFAASARVIGLFGPNVPFE